MCELPTFEELRRRHGGVPLDVEDTFKETARLMRYLDQLGLLVSTAENLMTATAGLAEEEEITAERCKEGVAVSHASDGWWLLLPYGEILIDSARGVAGDYPC